MSKSIQLLFLILKKRSRRTICNNINSKCHYINRSLSRIWFQRKFTFPTRSAWRESINKQWLEIHVWRRCKLNKIVVTLALGSWPRQGLAKVRAENETWEPHFMLPRVWESVREWTFTLSNEFPLWEVQSRWTSKSLENNFRGQNPLDRGFPYIIEKILELRCLKLTCMTHLGD